MTTMTTSTTTTTTLDPNRREWKGFLKSMRADRGEDTVRLAFSDWLEETFGPNAFSSFIREQIEYSRRYQANQFSPIAKYIRQAKVMSPEWHHQQRITSLFHRCWGVANWNVTNGLVRPDPNVGPDHSAMWDFSRGFPSKIFCTVNWWISNHAKICSIGPVGSLILTDYPDVWRNDLLDGRIAYWFRGREIIVDSNPNDATRHAAIENLLRMVWKPGEEVESLRIILP